MTSKERVMAVFSHQIPDRIPMWCGASPDFMAKARSFPKRFCSVSMTISVGFIHVMPVRTNLIRTVVP